MTEPERQVGPWLAGVDFAIADRAAVYDRTTDYGAASLEAAAGYTLDPAAAHDMLSQTSEALEMLQAVKADAVNLQSVRPPAQDPASSAYNTRLTNGSGGIFDHALVQIDIEIAYLEELKGKIKEAFAKINGREATAADEMRRAGNQPPISPTQSPPPPPPGKGGAAG